jgi:dUTP pyrophosphatase
MERIRVEIVNTDARVPRYASPQAAGADIQASLDAPLEILPGDTALIPTGLQLAIPAGYEGQIRPRSGLALNQGLTVLNAPGTIDSDYRGELKILLINHGKKPAVIHPGDRIAQIVFAPAVQAEFVPVSELCGSERGAGGFGSTG